MIEFHLSGQPGLNGFEDSNGGYLSWSYSTGVDTRFPGVVQLAPLLTSVDLSGSQSSAANASKIVFSEGMTTGTAELAVVANGARPTTIRLDTRAYVSTASTAAYGAAITDLIYTIAANGTEEISAALGSTIYQVITAFNGGTTSFTTSANDESNKFRIWLKGPSFEADGQVFGFGFGTGSVENLVRHNVQTGTVTMDASVWATRVTMSSSKITFTGAALDGSIVLIGTTDGVYRYNNEHFVFIPYTPELTSSANNGKNMAYWSKLGTVVPLEYETRRFVQLDSESIGPERFSRNNSPVQGRLTAQDYAPRWGMWAIYNQFADATYLCWVRPRQSSEYTNTEGPVSIYPFNKLTDGVDCEAIAYADVKGGVSNPTWLVGQDGNVAWQIEGKQGRNPDDTSCAYQSSGTIYLTEVMRDPMKDKTVKAIGMRTQGCSSTETITPTITWLDKLGVSQSVTLNAINSNGTHIIHVPREKEIKSEAFQISLAFARGGTTTATPRIIRWGRSEVKCWYSESDLVDQNRNGIPSGN
jgi:hypothetical protein